MKKRHLVIITLFTILFLALLALNALPGQPVSVAVAPTRTPVVGTPPAKTTPTPGRKQGDDKKKDKDGPTTRPQKPNPTSAVSLAYTFTGDQVSVQLENTGPDDAGGVCLKVWGPLTSAWVEWGEATVRPGGADLCWHELYNGNGAKGGFTGQPDGYAELHWNGQYKVVAFTTGTARRGGGLASSLARPSLQTEFDLHPVAATWVTKTNTIQLPDGRQAGRAYDTMLWTAGRESVNPIGPALTLTSQPAAAIPVTNKAGSVAVFVTTPGGDYTHLDVYRLDSGATAWGLAYQEVLSGTYSLWQNETGPVLENGTEVRQAQLLEDGTVGFTYGPVAYWAHQLGDGNTIPIVNFEGLLGLRYDAGRNTYLVALLNSTNTPDPTPSPDPTETPSSNETPVVVDDPAAIAVDAVEVPADPTATPIPGTVTLTIGAAPSLYLDAVLISPMPKVAGQELEFIIVDGDFYCVQLDKSDGAQVNACTRAEFTLAGGGTTVPLMAEGPGSYAVPGHLDGDLTVTMHLYPIDGMTAAIRGVTLNYRQIVLPKVERSEPLDIDSGEAYVQFDAIHPRQLRGFGETLYTGIAEMPVSQAKLRQIFLDADIATSASVFVLSLSEPPKVLGSVEVKAPGWIALDNGVYEPFRLVIIAPFNEVTVRGAAVKWTWQGVY